MCACCVLAAAYMLSGMPALEADCFKLVQPCAGSEHLGLGSVFRAMLLLRPPPLVASCDLVSGDDDMFN